MFGVDVLVIGGGPAGMTAATAAANWIAEGSIPDSMAPFSLSRFENDADLAISRTGAAMHTDLDYDLAR